MFKKLIAAGMVLILILASFSSASALGTSFDRIEEIKSIHDKNLMKISFSSLDQIEEINKMNLDILGIRENTILAFLKQEDIEILGKRGFSLQKFDIFQEMEEFGFSQEEFYDLFSDFLDKKSIIGDSIRLPSLQTLQKSEEMKNLNELNCLISDILGDFPENECRIITEQSNYFLDCQDKEGPLIKPFLKEEIKKVKETLQSQENVALVVSQNKIQILKSPTDLDLLIGEFDQLLLPISSYRLETNGELLALPLVIPLMIVAVWFIISAFLGHLVAEYDFNGDGKGDMAVYIMEFGESYGNPISYECAKFIASLAATILIFLLPVFGYYYYITGSVAVAYAFTKMAIFSIFIDVQLLILKATIALAESIVCWPTSSNKIVSLQTLRNQASNSEIFDTLGRAIESSLDRLGSLLESSLFFGNSDRENGIKFNYDVSNGNRMYVFYRIDETVALREPKVFDPNGREISISSDDIMYFDSQTIRAMIKNPMPGQWTIEIPPAYDGKDHYVVAFVYSETAVIPTLEINSFAINNDDVMTDSVDVTLTIDAPGATEMRFKNDGGNWTAWEDYSQTKQWQIRSEAGPRTVYCEVRDDFGNTANSSDSITLQFQGPTNVSITINNGDEYTSSTDVTLTITATGATEMSFKNDSGSWTAWEPFRTTKSWTLQSIPGTRFVHLRVSDENGTIAYAQDSITLDMPGPTNVSITINNGDEYTSSTDVTLTIAATGATEMSFKNDSGSWTAWEPFRTTKSWTLLDVRGERTVYLRVRDSDFNEILDHDSIIYQVGPRDVSIIINNGDEYTSSTDVTLTITATGATEMSFKNDSGSWTAWEPFRTTKSWTLLDVRGERTVYLRVRDGDNNIVEAQDYIVLNIGPEINDFKIESGDTYCSSPEVTLYISATGATEMRFRNDSGSWTAWESFRNRRMWTLRSIQGTRTVEVRVRDSQGNESSMQDSIVLVLPDLTVSSSDITFSNNNPAVGEGISITMTVHNVGGAGYPEGGDAKSVVIYVYEGHPSNYNLLDEFSKTLIPAGDSYTFTMSYNKLYEGCFDIYVVIDQYDKVVELNESNNQDFNTVCFSNKLGSGDQYRSASDILIREHENIKVKSDESIEVENVIYIKSVPGMLTLTDSFPSTYQIIESSVPYITTPAGITTYVSWTIDTTSISEIIYTIGSTTDSVTSGLNVSFDLSPLQISNNYHGKLTVQVNIERQDQEPSIVKFTVPKENEYFTIEDISCGTAVILEGPDYFEVSIQTGLSTNVETNFLELSVRAKGIAGSTSLLSNISAKSIFFNDNFMGKAKVTGRDSLYIGSYDIETVLDSLDISISNKSVHSPILEPDQIVLEGIEEQGKNITLTLNVTNTGSGGFDGRISAVADNFIAEGSVTPGKLRLNPAEDGTIQVALKIPQDAVPSIYEGRLVFLDITGYSMNVPIQIFVYEDDFVRFLFPTVSRDILFAGMTQRLEVVVIDEDDAIIPGATVTLSGCGVESMVLITDANGKATFIVEPTEEGEITILAEKDDYVHGSKTITVKFPTYNTEQNSSFLMKQFESLAFYNIEKAKLLKSEAYSLLQKAKDMEYDLSETEEILEKADSSLETALIYFSEGNYIAANFWAIQAIKNYGIVIEMLEEILGNAHDYFGITQRY
jgi:hypothetical protein